MPADRRQKSVQTSPLGRAALPTEIARPCVFLASDSVSYMTGQALHVNGGTWMG
jgi:3-oxoacyl-[acyl-carrier protein] reductase